MNDDHAINTVAAALKETQRSGDAFSDLRGRQSVRATFKLTHNCVEAISIVAGQLGIKQKSLFDHLFQDAISLNTIAKTLPHQHESTGNRVQKTFVMSRNTLVSIETFARNYNAPRDAIIETAVQRLTPLILQERSRHNKRKAIAQKIKNHLEGGRRLLEEAYAELGEQDMLTERLVAVIGGYESAFRQLSAFIERTKDIEAFEPDTDDHG